MEINQPLILTVPLEVSEGGTGVTSFVPYAVITGGTTATGPLQQVSGLGTVGQVLMSNGAGTLPSWQDNGNGSVSVVSVVTANGFAGTVANPTTTPAITLTTTITGMLSGNGTSLTGRTITGTTNRITVTNGDGVSGNPTIDISASYVGQSSITTLGTITTGVWNGTKIGTVYGGTNLDSSASTGVAQVAVGVWSVSTALANGTTATTQSAGDNSTKVATTAYVDNIGYGSPWKLPVVAATTANGTFSTAFANGQVIDGVTLATGDRILIKNQASAPTNGIYIVQASGSPVRSTDADTGAKILGTAVYVTGGSANQFGTFVLENGNPTVNLGVDNLPFVHIITGDGSTTTNTNVNNTISVKSGGITATQLASDAVTTVKILDANVTYAKIQNIAGLSVMGRSTNSSGVGADITGTDGQVLRVSGTTLGFGTVAPAGGGTGLATLTAHAVMLGEGTSNVAFATIGTSGRLLIDQGAAADPSFNAMSGDATIINSGALTIASAAVTYAKFQNVAGLSVVGRSANSSGVSAAITGTDGQVLRVSGTALGFGTIATAGITDAAVTYAKIQNISATSRVLGRVTAGAGVTEELTLSQVLDFIGSAAQGDILYRGSSTWARLGAGTANNVLLTGGASANPSWGLAYQYIKVSEQQTQNTAGGTFTSGAWRTRVINTEDTDTGGNCSIASNQITLDAGTYECMISCPANLVNAHQTRLQNITDTSTILTGTSEDVSSTGSTVVTRSIICGRFTLAAQKTLEVQHQCATTRATNGFGVPNNFTTEIYTIAEFRKVL